MPSTEVVHLFHKAEQVSRADLPANVETFKLWWGITGRVPCHPDLGRFGPPSFSEKMCGPFFRRHMMARILVGFACRASWPMFVLMILQLVFGSGDAL
jgi:hypothetical protein